MQWWSLMKLHYCILLKVTIVNSYLRRMNIWTNIWIWIWTLD